MDILSIKIKIGDRDYPMKVKPEDEERVRKASKTINEKLKTYREKFGIDDKQDLLAMVAFDSLVAKMTTEDNVSEFDSASDDKISQLDSLITKALS